VIQPALLGGLFIGILSALPIINVANCCCLWVVAGGALSAHLLQQSDQRPIGSSRAAAVGVLAGIVGAGVWLVATIALNTVMMPLQERMIAVMTRNATDLSPEVREMLDVLANQAGGPLRLALGFTFHLTTGVIFATIGAVIAASMMGPDSGRQLTPPPLPPP
jgi:hypothetical protein